MITYVNEIFLFRRKDTLFKRKNTIFKKDTLFKRKDTLFKRKNTLFSRKEPLFKRIRLAGLKGEKVQLHEELENGGAEERLLLAGVAGCGGRGR
jgi:hypothetical protein